MSHPQLNTAQIHVMVQSITALHEEALASADNRAPSDTASPDTEPATPPTLILTSRAPGSAPLPPSVDSVAENGLDEAAAPHSAEIIDIMERIEALAAATEALPKEDEPVAETMSDADLAAAQQHLSGLMARIDALMEEAETAPMPEVIASEETISEENAIIDNITAHPLPTSESEEAATDAAMQDIQVAVQKATPQAEQSAPQMPAAGTKAPAPEMAAEASSGGISASLASMIRDEVRTIIREELPGEVRRIVKDTLQDQNIVPRERQKLRTSRFRNS